MDISLLLRDGRNSTNTVIEHFEKSFEAEERILQGPLIPWNIFKLHCFRVTSQ